MPVTIQTSDIAPRVWHQPSAGNIDSLFAGSCKMHSKTNKGMIQSSVSDEKLSSSHISPSTNGLVYSIFRAWSDHHHLVVRPDDIWCAVLSQLNFYINAHAEEVRSVFVPHQDRKNLKVIESGTLQTADFGGVAIKLTELMSTHLNDPDLTDWVMPNFSTTEASDRVVAAILIMGAMPKFFNYRYVLKCGIPSVTLLGDRTDYAAILTKLDTFPNLGDEVHRFVGLLRAVLKRFIASFDNPKAPETVEFWNCIAHKDGGSGPSYLSGWVTAFCFWDHQGNCLSDIREKTANFSTSGRTNSDHVFWDYDESDRKKNFKLDDIPFHNVDTNDIPSGCTTVPLSVNDNGTFIETRLLVGSVGIQVSSSGARTDSSHRYSQVVVKAGDAKGAPGPDTVQPLSAWWVYEVMDCKETRERKGKWQKEIEEKTETMRAMKEAGNDKTLSAEEWKKQFNRRKDVEIEIWDLKEKVNVLQAL